ncbi:MAG: ABC transporter permease [Parasporobacterium sp.]|nr:ABC transporter permease [Parasporobacterium sp.]
MRNVLRKRVGREIKAEWKKYLALFVLLTLTIGFVSGVFVANGSMEATAKNAYENYNIEDGNFTFKDKATDDLIASIEKEGIKTYEQFYKSAEEDFNLDGKKDAKVRVFKIRQEVNLACVMEGEMPDEINEIAIDRMHADNNGIKVGDDININGKSMKVTALVANSDYSALFENNVDIMFDAMTFNVALVTDECFEKIDESTNYQYAFVYDNKPISEEEKSEAAEDLAEKIAVLAATGGYLSDADEAKKLEEDIEKWTDYLEGVKEQADSLEARGNDLQERADTLQQRGDELAAEGAALEARKVELEAQAVALAERAVALQERMAAMTPEEQFIAAAELQTESEAIAAEQTKLEEEGNLLQTQASELQAKANELEAEGDILKSEGDALQTEADELESKSDEINAVKEKLEALEHFEDDQNELTDFIPEYANQAIHFSTDDFGSDKSMCEVLLIVLIVVIAFIFAITISNTINTEAKVIGTLRASGYSRGELSRHYISVPIMVTLISAIVGNILGYTLLKKVVVNMYYNSYSLPSYETLWSSEGFIKTTLYPLIIMIVINIVIVSVRMRTSPLKFLRNDLSSTRRKKAIKLPKWGFISRFRMRVFNQNIVGYLLLFIGILFVMVLLAFSVGMPATLDNYKKDAEKIILANYQYVLKDAVNDDGVEIKTEEKTAEKYSLNSLKTVDGVNPDEELSVYGYVENSKYFDLPYELEKNEVYVSNSYADKFGLEEGDTITLKEKYTAKTYEFSVVGIYELKGTLGIFMPNDNFNDVFAKDSGDFNGYLSDNEIKDIDEKEILNVFTVDDVLKMVNQLDHSLGGFMDYFSIICVIVAMIIMYLLTKLIIEKNSVSISMVKVLGYNNKEINSIYIRLTSIIVLLSTVITAFISIFVVDILWREIMYGMTGWFTFYISYKDIIKIIVLVIIAYFIIMLADMRRIKKIPLTQALKDVE